MLPQFCNHQNLPLRIIGFFMSPEEFTTYVQQGYNRIPVVKKILADLETPLSTFIKLGNQPRSYLFESVLGGETWGRYSIIGLPCDEYFQVQDHTFTHSKQGAVISQQELEDPLAHLEAIQEQFKVPRLAGLPRFTGGLVGYFGYDTVRYIEKRLDKKRRAIGEKDDPLNTPDIFLMLSTEVVVFDNLAGCLYIVVYADVAAGEDYVSAQARVDEIQLQLKQPVQNYLPDTTVRRSISEADFVSSFPKQQFKEAVNTIKDYILAGDVMQVVPSQRMTTPFAESPLSLYRALRHLNPSPYMYCMNLGDFHVVGSSPEILVREEAGVVTVRPIAGTRKRGKTVAEDLAMEQDLVNDPKEIAEHLMLIDLGRNDIGRIAKVGTVELTENMQVERYSTVMHIVSNVQGEIKPDLSPFDILKATFPAGTLSGAPKIRAMEIIDELEPVKRGIYGGAVGYISFQGDMDTAIAIRTAVIKDRQLHIQAGAGVVADSIPELEWKETMNKGRSIFRAAEMALNDLVPSADYKPSS